MEQSPAPAHCSNRAHSRHVLTVPDSSLVPLFFLPPLQPSMTSDFNSAPFSVPLPAAAVLTVPPPLWTGARVCSLAVPVLLVLALLTVAPLATFGPRSWYSDGPIPTTPYDSSYCQNAFKDDGSLFQLCTAAAYDDRCCPVRIGYGSMAACADDGLHCYPYDSIERFFIIVALWVLCAVASCVMCCCLRRQVRRQDVRNPLAADGMLIVVEDDGSYMRMQR